MNLNKKVDGDEAEEKSAAQILSSTSDVLTDIFLRLPLSSRFRFKSVSKHWQSLISDPELCILRNPDPNPAVGILFQFSPYTTNNQNAFVFPFDKLSTSPSFRKFSLSPTDPWRQKKVKILNSCNGLLICGGGDIHKSTWDYRVHNPITNKCSTIPVIDKEERGRNKVSAMILAFDPSKSPHHKVVCVLQLEYDQYQFKVYSSETGSWRDSVDQPFQAHGDFEDGVYWNGAIHWISKTQTGESIYFNLDDYDDDGILLPYKVMPTPPMINEPDYMHVRYFGESCDHLHYFDVYRWVWYYREYEFNVYEMRRDYSEWFVKFKVDIRNAVNRSNHSFKISPYTLVRGKKDEGSFLVLVVEKRIVRYNLVFKTFETIYEFDGTGNCPVGPDDCKALPLQYIESLCSV